MSPVLQSSINEFASLDPSDPSIANDIFALYARKIIKQSVEEGRGRFPVGREPIVWSALRALSLNASPNPAAPAEPVGILGAGAAGLYTALILLDLGIPFKIIEAHERVGGRLFTHTFSNETGAPYNYYDVGAMRFPQIISMRRLFHLFDYAPLNEGSLQLREKLTPYHFSNPNTLLDYNGETHRQSEVHTTSFQHAAVIQDVDPTPYITAGYKRIIDDVLEPFARGIDHYLKDGDKTGWRDLMSFDQYSARAYMNLCYIPSTSLQKEFGIPNKHLSMDVINWIETFENSTGAYDRSLTEIVLEAIAFGWNRDGKEPNWWCVKGGAFQIADTMYQYVNREAPDAFVFNKRVTSIKTAKDGNGIDVITDDCASKRFSHVVTSIPLPVLRTIDLTAADLNPKQSNALRQLTYGPSTKIGMQFRTAWWTTATNRAGRKLSIVSGQTYTDSPLRTVVYPSFGDAEQGKTTTLIASYCWTDDADRLGALTTNEELQPVLVKLVLRELARIHDLDVEFLRWELLDTHAWSWSHDSRTMGAFAFFGPGKFRSLYGSLTAPAARGRLHFAGEAISPRHAWVEGALDSAWRAVYEMLLVEPAWTPKLERFIRNWGCNGEWWRNPLDLAGKSRPLVPGLDGGVSLCSACWNGPRGGSAGGPEEGEDGDGELNVDRILRFSLLPQHIVTEQPETF